MPRLVASIPFKKMKRTIKHPLLNTDFIVDTGFQMSVACKNVIKTLKKLGYSTQKWDVTATVLCCGHKSEPKEIYSIDFPLYEDLFKGQPFIKDWVAKRNIIGVPLLKQCVIEVLEHTLNFYDEVPNEYSDFVQLKQPEKDRFYITLTVEGIENDYLFDTGHSTPIVMPYRLHNIASDAIRGNNIWTFGVVNESIDNYQSANLHVHLGDRIFIPRIALFTDIADNPYAINPFFLFKDTPFIIDLCNSRIGFMDNRK